MRKTLLMVGAWDGAARLLSSAVGSDWRVLHTPSCDDASDAADDINPSMVVLCGSDAVAGWRRAAGTRSARPESARRPGPSLRRSPRRGIRAALEFIDSNHAEPITLDDAARAATYSRCHFSKTFKEEVGLGFVAYLTSVRIAHAKRLLTSSDLSVTDAAMTVGFGDLCHFERVFRRELGETPSQFRARSQLS